MQLQRLVSTHPAPRAPGDAPWASGDALLHSLKAVRVSKRKNNKRKHGVRSASPFLNPFWASRS
eukprot:366505-Chlamydomonas_euryale.AAC.4